MPRLRLAAIIVNYRTPELTLRALDSLLPQLNPERDEVILVDNGSGDSSVAWLSRRLRARFRGAPVRLVDVGRNRGFSAGINRGFREVDAEHYLVLNSDVIVREGAVSAFLASARSRPQPALVAPQLEDLDGQAQISSFPYPSPLGELVESAGTGPITRLAAKHAARSSGRPAEDLRWVSFAAFLVSRSTLEEVGLLDEGFFMFYEDVDYCRRVLDSGGRIVTCPEARIVHLRGGSSPVKRLRKERERLPAYFYESRSRYFTKHHGRSALWFANASWTFGQGVAALRELAGRPRHNARGAMRDIWRGAARLAPGRGV